MFGFEIIGALLLAAAAHLPTSEGGGPFCTVCSAPEPITHGCAQSKQCAEMCVYFCAGDPEMNHWSCFENVPEQWKGVNIRGRWSTKTENFIISHEYYPHEISHPNPWIHAAYTCTTDFCNDLTDYSGTRRLGNGTRDGDGTKHVRGMDDGNDTTTTGSGPTLTTQNEFRVRLFLLLTLVPLILFR